MLETLSKLRPALWALQAGPLLIQALEDGSFEALVDP